MALEIEITKLTAAVEKQNTLLEKLLSAGAKNTAAAATAPADKGETAATAAEDKPKTTAKPKAEKPAAETKAETKAEAPEITVETLDAKFRPWLAEFDKGHPERVARQAKFKEILGKLGAEKMSAIEDAGKLAKLDNWFETKAKTWDEGHGVGRFAADPEEGGDEGGDDDL